MALFTLSPEPLTKTRQAPPPPHSLALFARSFAIEKTSSPFLSTISALLQQNTRGGIKSDSLFRLATRHSPLVHADPVGATNSCRIRTYRRVPSFAVFWPYESPTTPLDSAPTDTLSVSPLESALTKSEGRGGNIASQSASVFGALFRSSTFNFQLSSTGPWISRKRGG